MNLYYAGDFQVKVPKSLLNIPKNNFRDLLLEIWSSLDGDTRRKMEQDFGIQESGSTVQKILSIDAQPILSPLDVFFQNMIEGKFDKSYTNERIIDQKIAALQYEQIIEKNKATAEKRKATKNQMKIEFQELSDEEFSSNSTYDSNFEENEDSENETSKVGHIILRHKKSLRTPISQKNPSHSGQTSKVNTQ